MKDSSTTLDGNTLKGFVSCTTNIAGMADQDAQLKTQTEDFFGWIQEQISFELWGLVMCNTLHVIVQLSCGGWGILFVFFNYSMCNTNYVDIKFLITTSIHRPTV